MSLEAPFDTDKVSPNPVVVVILTFLPFLLFVVFPRWESLGIMFEELREELFTWLYLVKTFDLSSVYHYWCEEKTFLFYSSIEKSSMALRLLF